MRLTQIIERRASDKVGALQQLEKYAGKGNIFVSFTAIDKIGINPDQTVAAGTPYGIYCYNLDLMIDDMRSAGKASNVPAMGDKPYIWVLQENGGNFIHSPSQYTEQMFSEDLKKLKGFYQKYADERDYMYMGADVSQSGDSPFAKLIFMTKEAAKDAAQASGKPMPLMWNVAFRFLGYTGITDDGTGVIHPNEPTQSIFFSKSGFKVVDKIMNTEHDGKTDRVQRELSPTKDQAAQKKAERDRFDQQRMDRFAANKKGA